MMADGAPQLNSERVGEPARGAALSSRRENKVFESQFVPVELLASLCAFLDSRCDGRLAALGDLLCRLSSLG